MKLINNLNRDITYEVVGRNQVYLTESEEIELISQYRQAKNGLHRYLLARDTCRNWFVNLYAEAKASGKSTAKLCADYNPRELGHNDKIENRLRVSLSIFHTITAIDLERKLLFDLNLSDDCYDEMLKKVRPTKVLTEILDRIHEIENTLFCSMLMAGQEIAKKYTSATLNIDEADAAQEVSVHLLESIRKYNSDYRTPQGQRVKLCTYAYGRAENKLKEWILSNSRLVRIPRSKMDRILIIIKAYDNLIEHDANLYTLTIEANSILKERKGKLTKANTFTIEEVDSLIKILTSNYIHLDQPYNKHNKSNQTTIGELLSKRGPSVIDEIESKTNKKKLLDLMKRTLTKLEYQIIILRYFHDMRDTIPKALSEVGDLLASVYGGKRYSRESIRKIEKTALDRLREVEEIQSLW